MGEGMAVAGASSSFVGDNDSSIAAASHPTPPIQTMMVIKKVARKRRTDASAAKRKSDLQDLHVVAEGYSAQYTDIVISAIAHSITRSLVLKKFEKATLLWWPAKCRKSKASWKKKI